MLSVATEQVSCIDLILNIVQTGVVAVGYDRVATALELIQVVYYLAAKECVTILESGLIDDHLGSLGLNAFHYTLNGTLTEVV